jgi:bifunctional DNA-binding transcriptional regulator/antitoxin component of YhaV-PrlF toxin-antitoxin module
MLCLPYIVKNNYVIKGVSRLHFQLSKDAKITLPDNIMEEFDLKPGDGIDLEIEQGKITLKKTAGREEKTMKEVLRRFDLWDIYGIFIAGAMILAIYSMIFRGMF